MIVVQMRRRIFRQTIQIEEARVTSLPTKVVKYDGKAASKCATKALAVHCAVLPISNSDSYYVIFCDEYRKICKQLCCQGVSR